MNKSRVQWTCTKLIPRFVDTTYLRNMDAIYWRRSRMQARYIKYQRCAQRFVTLSSSLVSNETFEGKGKCVFQS